AGPARTRYWRDQLPSYLCGHRRVGLYRAYWLGISARQGYGQFPRLVTPRTACLCLRSHSMNPDANERRINAEQLQRWVTTIFLRCGMNEPDAALLADSLVFADLSGVN